MAEHMEYWQQLLQDGRVVVYGPVADPEGVWGLGVLRASDRAEVLEIGERDPSVVAGIIHLRGVRDHGRADRLNARRPRRRQSQTTVHSSTARKTKT